MKNEYGIPKVKLNNISLIIVIVLIIAFLITQKTILITLDSGIFIYSIDMLSILFIMGYLYKFGIPEGKIKFIFVAFFLYISFILLYSITTSDADGLATTPKLLVLSLLLFLLAFADWTVAKFLIIAYMFSGLALIIFFQWFAVDQTFKYGWFFVNPNTLGIVMYVILFIHLIAFVVKKDIINRTFFVFIVFADLVILLVSTSRSVWFALFVAVFTYLSYNVINKNKFNYRISFMIILFVAMSITYIYPKLYSMDFGWKLNNYIYNYTGKNLFSGRQELWSHLLFFIEKKPFLGYGVSSSPSDFFQTDLASHNTYIAVLLQTGLVGLVFYFLILFVVWELLYVETTRGLFNVQSSKLLFSFFAGLLIYQVFEMTLIKGGYSIDVLQWMLIAIGIGAINSQRKKKRIP